MANEVAQNIANQIGNHAFAMIGAKNLTDCGNGLAFRVGKNPKRATHVHIIYRAASDDYQFRVLRQHGLKQNFRIDVLMDCEGVYCDQLTDLISEGTGLAVSL